MNFNFDSAFDNVTQELDKKTGFTADSRFYNLKKTDKSGSALIRFLPSELFEDGSMSTVKRVYRYNVRGTGKHFISEWSPSTIGKTDPIQERWAKLWNAGQKEESKRYARSERYIANIKVLKDPATPENEGKIFLLDMSKSLMDKVRAIMVPSKEELAMGKKAKNLFDPVNGYDFMLIAKPGANDMVTYLDSDAAAEPKAAYTSIDEAVKDIQTNCYKLSDWDKDEAYPTYEYLKEQLAKIDGEDSVAVENTQTQESFVAQEVSQTQTAPAQPAQGAGTAGLDDLLNSLGK